MSYVPVRSNPRLLAAFGIGLQSEDWKPELWPRYQGPIVRRDAERIDLGLQSIAATWGLLPWWAKAPKIGWSTVNARSEDVESKASYRDAWKRGQRCIIPMESFFEPNWESGQHVRWRFWRTDGAPMGIAGLWERWRPKDQDGEELITLHGADRQRQCPSPHAADAQARRGEADDGGSLRKRLCTVAGSAIAASTFPADLVSGQRSRRRPGAAPCEGYTSVALKQSRRPFPLPPMRGQCVPPSSSSSEHHGAIEPELMCLRRRSLAGTSRSPEANQLPCRP
ncbi:SOS response-associated peptidase [Eleftheria terrae]|uniref:SOS response-associated peptidase n=1 Tax=Eleftheria terrae TaxID=1597781 RepID=UPI00263AFAD9|nr:SOS response-associated peptidase family protein [Eleftheria terrae]WKB54396.1 SOS response-associated peptidase [Eleftheria terrae]